MVWLSEGEVESRNGNVNTNIPFFSLNPPVLFPCPAPAVLPDPCSVCPEYGAVSICVPNLVLLCCSLRSSGSGADLLPKPAPPVHCVIRRYEVSRVGEIGVV